MRLTSLPGSTLNTKEISDTQHGIQPDTQRQGDLGTVRRLTLH
jgi:hypothetical protein